MNLKHIHTPFCPTCGAKISEDNQRSPHCNGQFFERRTFDCGYQMEWVPNFSALRDVYQCQRSPAWKAKLAKREETADAVRKLMKKLNVDDKFAERIDNELKNSIRYA